MEINRVVNTELISNPVNWVIVFLMVLFFGFSLSLIFNLNKG
jgi:hypothetical protein